ncbi:S-DNA-T family DNA segregation ATPase FtsK/SpoIIIE [Halopolyspora algeriensis]|uniref:S-DNA-T family DNA segregation ATPase FtsK/SpoIIIE n=1 Tax=Halopolyspora algeriensis TaxID=1500506 RepID=A0A368VUD1_9ACTN|nr:FtsK/SpoIIIE domain-containing protein [Halopolyspora algeriensis]RCW44683.1 S-DNA-T family DNA segregation ATPase FtsK/SpoIIIE [Halopolyspora algeriensis]TQM56041.1 S-DNA-T family DNA segregation ATPase FtsK/SpoIIIE [Halopolyspora algeriensis]
MWTKTRSADSVPVSGLSIYDPVHLGIDEHGRRVDIELVYRNILFGGEPGSGKSSGLQNIIGHASMCTDCQLWLFDGKQVELGLWRSIADVFVGPDITEAIDRLEQLQKEMDRRYDELDQVRRRKITSVDPVDVIVAVIDEIALFSATLGSKDQQEQFVRLLRDLVARGRAAGVIVVAATQRPSADIVPTSLRDIFAYRCAFRCTTEASSDTILGRGWAQQGYSATAIAPENLGVGLLLAEGGIPRRMKYAYLTDAHIYGLVEHSQHLRTQHAA